jgi:hypothetical protein
MAQIIAQYMGVCATKGHFYNNLFAYLIKLLFLCTRFVGNYY